MLPFGTGWPRRERPPSWDAGIGLQLAVAIQHAQDRGEDIQQGFEKLDHGDSLGGDQATAPAHTPLAGYDLELSAIKG